MDNGWVLLHRQLFESPLWKQKPFGKGQAWIDLFANANHSTGSFWIRSNEIKLERGQIGWSELTMADRWGWSRMKCRRFLNDLEVRQQIRQQKNHLTTIITILNYEKFQERDNKRDSRRDIKKTADETQTKNDNNVKEITLSPSQQADKFFKEPEPLIQMLINKGYPEPIIRTEIKKFIAYWTEPNKLGSRTKWQIQQTFEIQRRLTTWFRNIKSNPKKGERKIWTQDSIQTQ